MSHTAVGSVSATIAPKESIIRVARSGNAAAASSASIASIARITHHAGHIAPTAYIAVTKSASETINLINVREAADELAPAMTTNAWASLSSTKTSDHHFTTHSTSPHSSKFCHSRVCLIFPIVILVTTFLLLLFAIFLQQRQLWRRRHPFGPEPVGGRPEPAPRPDPWPDLVLQTWPRNNQW